VEPAQWEINMGPEPAPSIMWLQAFACDSIYISDKRSEEVYKDLQYPEKFKGILPLLFDDDKGNFIYKVPRRYSDRARVVDTAALDKTAQPRFNDDIANLRAYVDVIEKGPDSPATFRRNGTDAMRIGATVAAGQSIVVQESYDPAFQAWAGDKRFPVRKDALGFMVIDAPPGTHEIDLRFVTPKQNWFGRGLTVGTILILGALLFRKRTVE
jgi:hypothetical protein